MSMQQTWDPTEHPRDRVGKFTDKHGTRPAAGTLTKPPAPQPDRPVFTGYSTVEEKVEAMRAELEAAVDRLADDDEWNHYLNTMSRFHRYSLNNQLMIWIQKPDATRVAGFRQWKELGRSVRKGEKGIAIFAPRTAPALDDNGEKILDENGKPVRKVVGFTSATVFDISQTEGEPLPEVHRELTEEPPAGYIEDLEAACASSGYPVTYETITNGALGYTSRAEKQIVIDERLSPGSRATTLAHELGHVLSGHVDDDETRTYSTSHGGKRGEMEVEAESFAYVLSRMNGMQTHLRGASTYVAGWQTYEPGAIRNVTDRLNTAVKKAMSLTWRNLTAD